MQIFFAHLLTGLAFAGLISIGSILSDLWLTASLNRDGMYPYRDDDTPDPRDRNA